MSDITPENSSDIDPALLPASPGTRPAWNVSDLPAPPDFNFRNIIRIIGPGAIVLSMSIGLGEWVLGPLVVTQYGFTMLWVVTVAIILQLVLNLEFVRYTVYTGEPVINGFMRLAPHPLFWGGIYILLSLFHTGWPAWAAGCFVGMFLNCILAAHIIPAGTEISGLSIGAFQAEYLAREGGALLGFVTLVNGFWILFGSQLVTIDLMARINTDLIWSISARIRRITGNDIRRLYYSLLGIFVLWGCIAINLAQPRALVLISSNVAGFILVVSAVHILLLNRKALPRAVQSPWWARSLVACTALFYGFFFVQNLIELAGR